jgi:hypothetical protein
MLLTQELIQGNDSASLCSLAGRHEHDNPIPTRLLALKDCSKIPALGKAEAEFMNVQFR